MKIKIIEGPETDKNIQKCYQLILNLYLKQLKKENEANETKTGA